MTSLHTKLKELRELRERATQGRMVFGPSKLHHGLFYTGYVAGKDPSPEFQIYIEAEFAGYGDADFFCQSANHWLTLIACLEKAIGALEYIRVDIKFDRKEDVIVTKCDEALAEIAEMLEGK